MSMIADVQKELLGSISKAHDALKRELIKLRAGRASASLLDGIRADYYGTPTALTQMAHVNVPEPRLITVKPWDKTQIKGVEKALRESDLGLNPRVDGDLVRSPLPPLTEERRKELVKKLHAVAEDHRVSLRNVRRDANEHIKKLLKDKLISEDEDRRAHDEIQKLTDNYIAKLDQAVKTKEKEVLEIK